MGKLLKITSNNNKYLFLLCVLLSCIWNMPLQAEVINIAVGQIQIEGNVKDKQTSAICELWNATLIEKLSEFESVAVLEREQLSQLLEELKLSLTDLSDPNSNMQVQKLLGADILVLGEVKVTNSVYTLSSRLVSAKDGSIEKYFNIATVIAIVLLVMLAYLIKKLGHIFTG